MKKIYNVEVSIQSMKRKSTHSYEYENEQDMIKGMGLFREAIILSKKGSIKNVGNLYVECSIKFVN